MSKEKNLWRLLAIMMVAMLSVGFASCGDDGESDDGTITPDPPTQSELDKFIGCWSDGSMPQTRPTRTLWFLPDGTCFDSSWEEVSWEKSMIRVIQSLNTKTGKWNYDKTAKQLATTIDGKIWIISIFTDEAWTGVSAKIGKSETYYNDNLYFLELFVEMMEENVNSALLQYYKNKQYQDVYTNYHDIEISSNVIKANDVRVFITSKYGSSTTDIFSGSITINNYGRENAKMIVEGKIVTKDEDFKKEISAAKYLKDGKFVSVKN